MVYLHKCPGIVRSLQRSHSLPGKHHVKSRHPCPNPSSAPARPGQPPRARAWPPGLPMVSTPQPQVPPGSRLLALHLPLRQGPDVAVTLLYLPRRDPRPGRSRRGSPAQQAAGRRRAVPGTQEPRPQKTTPAAMTTLASPLRPRQVQDEELEPRMTVASFTPTPDSVPEPLRGRENRGS